MHLLSRAEVPDWCEPSPFILSGYRSPSHSWAASLASWSYCHNETGNIFSHLLPSLVLALGGLLIGFDLSSPDEAAVALHLVSAILCLSLSTLYHTGLNHSPSVAYRWLQLDYGGILALILGNFISGVHFGFYCDPALKMLYWSLIIAASSGTGMVLLSPWFRAPEWRGLRLASCIATGMFAFAPIGHAWYLWGTAHVLRIGTPYYLLEGALLLAGCYIYQNRVPESLYPGRFDIWGHSHTLWHVFVVLSVIAHVVGLWSAREFNSRNVC